MRPPGLHKAIIRLITLVRSLCPLNAMSARPVTSSALLATMKSASVAQPGASPRRRDRRADAAARRAHADKGHDLDSSRRASTTTSTSMRIDRKPLMRRASGDLLRRGDQPSPGLELLRARLPRGMRCAPPAVKQLDLSGVTIRLTAGTRKHSSRGWSARCCPPGRKRRDSRSHRLRS